MPDIDIIFSLNASDTDYQQSIGSWLPVVKGNLFAHVVVNQANAHRFPDIIDWLLGHDIRLLVSKMEDTSEIAAQAALVSFTEPSAPHVLLVQRGARLVRANGWLGDHLWLFDKYRDMLTIDVLPLDRSSVDPLVTVNHCPFRATLLRARDLYVSAQIVLTNPVQSGSIADVLSSFSRAPYRHLAVNPSVLLCS